MGSGWNNVTIIQYIEEEFHFDLHKMHGDFLKSILTQLFLVHFDWIKTLDMQG